MGKQTKPSHDDKGVLGLLIIHHIDGKLSCSRKVANAAARSSSRAWSNDRCPRLLIMYFGSDYINPMHANDTQ